MPLSVGTRLGPYELLEPIGAGGMGEVYRARDTKLGRDVALKALPDTFAQDADRMARFEREAQILACLNHPNIASIYGLEESGRVRALVMELVGGATLAERLHSGPCPLEEAVPLARQIADALEAAHEHGIVHRDLKPANIKVTPDGTVKVLDFGLAKAFDAEGSVSNISNSPTLTVTPTQTGVILGTAAYMSPEQARGKRVDRRADIWAFGVVLYEMLTGKRPFEGESTPDMLAAVLKTEVDWDALPTDVPAIIRKLLQRCLEKDPKLRLRDIGEARIALSASEQLEPEAQPLPVSEAKTRPSAALWWWVASAAAIALALVAEWWWLRRPPPSPPPWKLTRLTADSGLSDSPALSPDGKLLAYASDRGSDSGPDLYVKQVAGGQPIRLTSDGAGNTTPDFSPDGSKIVFRSDRAGGGIYQIPAFGGDARLVARDGWDPKFSPDGSQVAYWVGDAGVSPLVPASGGVWVVSALGGTPRRVGPSLTAASRPVWSPDGKHLLLIGYTSAKAYQYSSIDWWVVATDGNHTARTGAYDALVRAGLEPLGPARDTFPVPACWSATADTVMFSLASGAVYNLWEIGVSPQTGKVGAAPQRLTTGAANEAQPSCAQGGALAYTNVDSRAHIWSLPADLDHGTAKGALQRITEGPAGHEHTSLSKDGRYVAFASDQSGQMNIWVRDFVTGKESSVDSSPLVERYPVITASGKVAYSVFEKDQRVVYVSSPGGTPERLCEGCLRATDWSRDEKTVLVFGGDPYQVNLLDVASHQQTPLLKHPSYPLIYARFSPDDRWVSFTVRTESNRGHIAIAPVDGPKPVPESAWITIAPSEAQDWANWSPDGRTLYFTSRRDGHRCLWAQRLDPASHRPAGEPFAVEHFHGRVSYEQGGWSAAGGRIAMVLVEDTGNIWMMSRSESH